MTEMMQPMAALFVVAGMRILLPMGREIVVSHSIRHYSTVTFEADNGERYTVENSTRVYEIYDE